MAEECEIFLFKLLAACFVFYPVYLNKHFFCIFFSPRHVIENAKRKKNVRLATSMNLSSMIVPDYGKMCPNFWLGENQKIANPWPFIGPETVRSSQMRPNPGLCLVELDFP